MNWVAWNGLICIICFIHTHSSSLQLSSEKGLEEDVIFKEADAILEEMGHNLNMTTLRSLATIFANIFRQLFRHVYVNQSGIQKVGFPTAQNLTPL